MSQKFLAALAVFALVVVSITALDANAGPDDAVSATDGTDQCRPPLAPTTFQCAPAIGYAGPFTSPPSTEPAFGFGRGRVDVLAPMPVDTSVPVPPPPPPPPPPTNPTCMPTSTVMCLIGSGFSARVMWAASGTVGDGMVVPTPSDNSGNFWFRGPETKEILLRIVDGCDENGNYQIMVVSATDLAWGLTVTDTQTGAVRQYQNELGVASPAIIDTNAFATCP